MCFLVRIAAAFTTHAAHLSDQFLTALHSSTPPVTSIFAAAPILCSFTALLCVHRLCSIYCCGDRRLPSQLYKMGAYKYLEELWRKKQSDVLRFLLRVRAWEYRQLPKVSYP